MNGNRLFIVTDMGNSGLTGDKYRHIECPGCSIMAKFLKDNGYYTIAIIGSALIQNISIWETLNRTAQIEQRACDMALKNFLLKL